MTYGENGLGEKFKKLELHRDVLQPGDRGDLDLARDERVHERRHRLVILARA